MIELRLRYEGGGRFQTLTRLDLELAAGTFQQGEEVAAKVAHSRSVRQNNIFHVMVQFAFDNQRAGPVFPSWPYLKQWLLIRAEHYNERRIAVGNLSLREAKAAGHALALSLRARDGYVGVSYDPKTHEFVERTARSVRFTATLSDEMTELFDKVQHLICQEIIPGTDPDDLIAMVKGSLKGNRERKAA